jgi:UDP-N-acetylglucosamine--N-acetylmuramyl-(pentapeptide) pyrophosphoryl-undecaprenol N-acetylglucosamine transferase
MAGAYARADFMICAAGAGTLAEAAALGLPSLVVPISAVADDHQAVNARAFASRTGATWMREADWNEAVVAEVMARTLADAAAWTVAAARMRAAAQLDAASAVVRACEGLLAARRRGARIDALKAADPKRSAKR